MICNNNSRPILNYRILVNLSIVALAVIIGIVHSLPSKKVLLTNQPSHGIRLQPELDKVDLDAYLANRKALALQVQCVVYDGPCDWVGRWVKPRVTSALLGECLLCTEYQKSHMERIMTHIQAHFPEEFKLGVEKYLRLAGIDVPTDAPQMISANLEDAISTTTEITTSAKPTTSPKPNVKKSIK